MPFTGRDLSRDIPIFGGLRGNPFQNPGVTFPGPFEGTSNTAVFEGGLRDIGRSYCRVDTSCATEKEICGEKFRC